MRRNEKLHQRHEVTAENKHKTLRDECDGNDPGRHWKRLSDAMAEGNQNVLPEKRRINSWITEKIFYLIDERRTTKGKDNI